ncbi:MAG: 23S rRNA (guanosine(2251)-2'-O)-methyltransferase RlmB [Pseudomonadota bacterium]
MLIYGLNPVNDAISFVPEKIKAIFCTEKTLNKINYKRSKIQIVDPAYFQKHFKEQTHQFIAAEVVFEYKDLNFLKKLISNQKKSSTILVLDHIQDPQNFGAIIRSAKAFAVDCIVIPNKRTSLVNSTVVKASSGMALLLPIVQVANLSNCLELLKKENFWTYGLAMKGEKLSTKSKFDKKTCLVAGSEGLGISSLIEKNCDFLISIPMEAKVESLNVSVSVGILLNKIYLEQF